MSDSPHVSPIIINKEKRTPFIKLLLNMSTPVIKKLKYVNPGDFEAVIGLRGLSPHDGIHPLLLKAL